MNMLFSQNDSFALMIIEALAVGVIFSVFYVIIASLGCLILNFLKKDE